MSDWDSFVDCVETTDSMVAQFLRTEGLRAFDDSKDVALACVQAVTNWWENLDSKVKWVIVFAGGSLSSAAKKRLGALIAEAGLVGTALAVADGAAYIALFLGVLLASFEIGVLVTASVQCLVG